MQRQRGEVSLWCCYIMWCFVYSRSHLTLPSPPSFLVLLLSLPLLLPSSSLSPSFVYSPSFPPLPPPPSPSFSPLLLSFLIHSVNPPFQSSEVADPRLDPYFTIPAAMTFTAQFVELIADTLDQPLPYPLPRQTIIR